MIRLICGVAALAAVAGCSPIQPPEPAADHPASPQAAQAEDAELSDVLAVDEENLPRTPPEMRRDMMHHGHGQMDGEMTGPSSPETEAAGYSCPMHPKVVSQEPGRCHECGFDLIPEGGPGHE